MPIRGRPQDFFPGMGKLGDMGTEVPPVGSMGGAELTCFENNAQNHFTIFPGRGTASAPLRMPESAQCPSLASVYTGNALSHCTAATNHLHTITASRRSDRLDAPQNEATVCPKLTQRSEAAADSAASAPL